MLGKLEMVELILSKWPTLYCFCLASPLAAHFWLCSCCFWSRFFYGLILWVPEVFADIKDIKNSLDTVVKCQSQVGQCWTPAAILALGLAPSTSETVKDLSLDPAMGSSACVMALTQWLRDTNTHATEELWATWFAWLRALYHPNLGSWVSCNTKWVTHSVLLISFFLSW